jgi:hypothetical protein
VIELDGREIIAVRYGSCFTAALPILDHGNARAESLYLLKHV